jgi:hypothetical protein
VVAIVRVTVVIIVVTVMVVVAVVIIVSLLATVITEALLPLGASSPISFNIGVSVRCLQQLVDGGWLLAV